MQFKIDGGNLGAEDTTAPYSVSWSSGNVPNGAHNVTAVARDAAGNTSSSLRSVTVSNDTTAPTVGLTNPASGATVSGAVSVAATASDNVGVVGVQFKIDGGNLGAEDTTAPYSVSWSSGNVPNGAHNVTAVARDAAGNTANSQRTVTVSNPSASALRTEGRLGAAGAFERGDDQCDECQPPALSRQLPRLPAEHRRAAEARAVDRRRP